jgi:peroxiredoxin Q/BCP
MIGGHVENFILKDQDGNDYNLYENLNTKVLIVFYPKDDTPICNLQLSDYDLNFELFEKNNIRIVGINTGDITEHNHYCKQKGFKFPLLSDIDNKVSGQFKALNLFGQNKRKLILIGTDKKVLYEKTVFSFLYLNSEQIVKSLKELKII